MHFSINSMGSRMELPPHGLIHRFSQPLRAIPLPPAHWRTIPEVHQRFLVSGKRHFEAPVASSALLPPSRAPPEKVSIVSGMNFRSRGMVAENEASCFLRLLEIKER